MLVFLGVALLAVAVMLLIRAIPRSGRRTAASALPDRRSTWIGLASLAVGVAILLWARVASAQMASKDLVRHADWLMNPETSATAPLHWDGNTLVAELEAGSNRYAVFPVDWDANRFSASWDITFTELDRQGDTVPLKLDGKDVQHHRSALDFASVAVGLMDQAAANIDDRDHVSGSGIEACFSDDIRLRASDANYLVRSASHEESGELKPDPNFHPAPTGVVIELNRKYHCALSYDSSSSNAELTVQDEKGRTVVRRVLRELKDFTNSVAWFGVSIRGYNRYDKRLDPKKKENGYQRPKAVVRLENLEYRQP